jgi:hypothetical protein
VLNLLDRHCEKAKDHHVLDKMGCESPSEPPRLDHALGPNPSSESRHEHCPIRTAARSSDRLRRALRRAEMLLWAERRFLNRREERCGIETPRSLRSTLTWPRPKGALTGERGPGQFEDAKEWVGLIEEIAPAASCGTEINLQVSCSNKSCNRRMVMHAAARFTF